MIILGIETSCDETGAAVLKQQNNRIQILSNIVASSASLQAKYGGIIPEQAAREQIKAIIPVIEEALTQAFPDVIPANAGIQLNNSSSELDPRLRGDDRINKINAIAVTYGPGLIGSLLVGVETAKVLAKIWNKPLIPINHLIGHFYANWITPSVIPANAGIQLNNSSSELDPRLRGDDNLSVPLFPCIGLLVSGGHTDLVLFKDHGKYKYLGGTRDDAAGECFDKCARILGLPYPGGPEISKLAQKGDPQTFNFPRPMIDSKNLDFSFSGLKTAVANLISTFEVKKSSYTWNVGSSPKEVKCDLAASIEQAIVDVLVSKTLKAAKLHKVKHLMVAGGVAANQKLASELKFKIENLKLKINLHIPSANLCTDNGAMIAAAAFFQKPTGDPLKLQADPNLSLS